MNVIRIAVKCGKSGLSTTVHGRRISQFNHHDGESLWKSVKADTGKSGGRGKRTKKRKTADLGADKILGEGKGGFRWPGLNSSANNNISQRTEEEQAQWEESRRRAAPMFQRKLDGTLRGWSGGLWGGQRLLADDEFATKFDSYILQASRVSHMVGSRGRIYSMRTIVAVGDGNGTYGIGMHTAQDVPNSARKSRMKALKRLQFAERYEDRTVFEDMYVNHHRTFMHIRQQPQGYGLRCHRVIKTLCDVIGIKDLYVNTNGSATTLSVVKCFVKALSAQETHQEKADRLGYHVVQYDPLRDGYPVVLASPQNGTKQEPYDEYNEYLRKPLIAKDVRRREGHHCHGWLNVQRPWSQGPPVPNASTVPKVFQQIKDAHL